MSPSDVVRSPDGDIQLEQGSVSEQRKYDAWQMRLRGADWEQICKTTGFSSIKMAQLAVRTYVQEAAMAIDQEHREEVLSTELGRLDALMNAVWDNALTGDPKSVDSAIKIIGMRAKLLNLDQMTMNTGTVTNNTVVVTGNTEEFIRSLELVKNP